MKGRVLLLKLHMIVFHIVCILEGLYLRFNSVELQFLFFRLFHICSKRWPARLWGWSAAADDSGTADAATKIDWRRGSTVERSEVR